MKLEDFLCMPQTSTGNWKFDECEVQTTWLLMVKFIVLCATNIIINIYESSVELLIKHKHKQLVYIRVLLKRSKENLFDLLFGNISLTVKLEVLKRPNSWEMWESGSCNQFACNLVACLTVGGTCTLVMFDFLDNRFDNWFDK